MKINKFENLDIWQESINLTKEIYCITSKGKFYKDFSFKDQIRRAIVSVPSNIAEGFERNNNNEFIRFLLISKGSIGELRTQFYIALEIGYLSQEDFNDLDQKFKNLSKKIGGFINYLKRKKKNGDFIR
ncbi:MAG: four helix bundle protein [Candidatus Pacebacteria bacterium]|nr:four helix bundle protein [Candidatus Paceibacterota bacterium]